jgi:phage tail sheath protein FI
MAVAVNYPGVYIQEIPSGVRTITGVATSITAVVGRSKVGPVNEPTVITSFADFVRLFGALDVAYPMGYAVQDFYSNGGQEAVIVRLWTPAGGDQTKDGKSKNKADTTLSLEAPYPGKAYDGTSITVDNTGIDDDVAKAQGLSKTDLFNLTIQYNPPDGPVEKIRNVSVVEGPRRVDRVLAQESRFLRVHTKADGTTLRRPTPPIPATRRS